MALTQDDLRRIREQVQLAIQDEEKGVPPMIQRFIDAHVQTCPHGRAVAKVRWLLVGIAIGAFVAGGGSTLAVVRFLL